MSSTAPDPLSEPKTIRDVANRVALLAAALVGAQEVAFKVPDPELQGLVGSAAIHAILLHGRIKARIEQMERDSHPHAGAGRAVASRR